MPHRVPSSSYSRPRPVRLLWGLCDCCRSQMRERSLRSTLFCREVATPARYVHRVSFLSGGFLEAAERYSGEVLGRVMFCRAVAWKVRFHRRRVVSSGRIGRKGDIKMEGESERDESSRWRWDVPSRPRTKAGLLGSSCRPRSFWSIVTRPNVRGNRLSCFA